MKTQTRPAWGAGYSAAMRGRGGNPFDTNLADGRVNPNWAAFRAGWEAAHEQMLRQLNQQHTADLAEGD